MARISGVIRDEKPAKGLSNAVSRWIPCKWEILIQQRIHGTTLQILGPFLQTEWEISAQTLYSSPKTSAAKACNSAPRSQASEASPAFRQVCDRKASRFQPHSTGT